MSNKNNKKEDNSKKSNFKITNQRQIIKDFVENNYNHPSVEEIYEHVKKILPRISKKTVYLNLEFLSNQKLIREIKIKGTQKYEPSIEKHSHFICKKCSKIIDLNFYDEDKYLESIKNKIKDLEIESSNISFYGLCSKCKQEKNKQK